MPQDDDMWRNYRHKLSPTTICVGATICVWIYFYNIGFAGGYWYDHPGTTAEFVCLPPDPDLTTMYTSSDAYMYGAEYDSGEFAPRVNDGDDFPCVHRRVPWVRPF